jgi:uncharacterized Tic20 family protein
MSDQASGRDSNRPESNAAEPLAVATEGLYLLGMLLPLLPLLGQSWIYTRHRDHERPVVRSHVRQCFVASLIAFGVFAAANLLTLALGGYATWAAMVVFEVYFVVFVPLLIIPGLIGLIKAMSGQDYRYPMIGKSLGKSLGKRLLGP